MRFLGLSLGDRVPDATTIWLLRERLVKAGAIKRLFERFDQSCLNLAAARLRHIAGTQWSTRRYMSMHPLNDLKLQATGTAVA